MEENKQNTELQNGEVVHKRRKRYSGTHPKKFSEKYKELNPEKWCYACGYAYFNYGSGNTRVFRY